MEAVQNVLPSSHMEDIIFERSNVEGHYGNPITFFDARIKNKETVNAIVENIAANLSSLDKEELDRTIDRYVEKGSLFIRLDKQAAFRGKTRFATSDPIRIRVRFRKNKTEDVIQICREIGILP
jgi:RNA binding exosome subunit